MYTLVSYAFFTHSIIVRREIHSCFRDFLIETRISSSIHKIYCCDRKCITATVNSFLCDEFYSFDRNNIFVIVNCLELFSFDLNNFLVTRNVFLSKAYFCRSSNNSFMWGLIMSLTWLSNPAQGRYYYWQN